MATESLIVELDARTKKLDARLKATEDKIDKLGGAAVKTNKKMATMSEGAKTLGKSVGVAGVAISALTAGTIALINKTTEYSKKIKIASKLSGVHAEQLQRMAFATNTVGIDVEKLGDIFKDSREKIGDFLNTGGGGFQDFADAMKLTKTEARLVAEEFSHLSGPEILQEMVTRMEEADVSFVQMSHALEGMASDTTNLIPLLKNGGKEMKTLSDAMADVTVPLTDEDIQKLEDLDVALKLAAESASSLATQTLVDLSDWFINAANAAAFFFSSLNEGSRADLQTKLLPVLDDIIDVERKLSKASGFEEVRLQRMLDKLVLEREQITKALAELNVKALPPELVSTEVDDSGIEKDSDIKKAIGGTGDEIRAIEDRFKAEEVLLQEKLERELAIVGDNNELKLQLEQEFQENLLQIEVEAEGRKQKSLDEEKKRLAKLQKEKDKQSKLDGKILKQNADRDKKLSNDAMSLASIVFEDSKSVSAGIALVNTATGVTKALSVQDYAGAAITAVMGATQIAAILGASKGGGSIPSAAGGPSATQQQQNFEPETTTQDISLNVVGDESSTDRIQVEFASDGGSASEEFLVSSLNDAQRRGSISVRGGRT